MNLGEYYKLNDRIGNAQGIYNELKNSAKAFSNTGPSKEDCEKLRLFLKDVFYPSDPDNSAVYQKVKKIVEQYYEKF